MLNQGITLSEYEVSKKVRHSQKTHREEDGAVHFWRIKENLQSQFPQTPYWSDDRWKARPAAGGGAKRRYQYCTDVSGIIVYLRALQGLSGRRQSGTSSHKMDKTLWQTFGSCDILHWFFNWSLTTLPCGKTQHNTVDRDCSKTPTLLGTLKIRNQHRGDFYVSSGVEHSFPTSWVCENQISVSHSSTESEVISLDAGLRMDGVPTLISVIPVIEGVRQVIWPRTCVNERHFHSWCMESSSPFVQHDEFFNVFS